MKKHKINSPMMDYMKQYPTPKKKKLIENAINDIINYKKKEYKKGYTKIIHQLAKKVINSKKSKNLSDYIVFKRVYYRDKLKKYIDLDIKNKFKKKTKRK